MKKNSKRKSKHKFGKWKIPPNSRVTDWDSKNLGTPNEGREADRWAWPDKEKTEGYD